MSSLSGGDGVGGTDVNEKVLGRTKASRLESAGVACSGFSEDVTCGLRLK